MRNGSLAQIDVRVVPGVGDQVTGLAFAAATSKLRSFVSHPGDQIDSRHVVLRAAGLHNSTCAWGV